MISKSERVFYLLTIAVLLSFMSYEFQFFVKHYTYLEQLNASIFKRCR